MEKKRYIVGIITLIVIIVTAIWLGVNSNAATEVSESGSAERTQKVETKTETIDTNAVSASEVKDKGDIGAGSSTFCIERNGALAEVAGKNLARIEGKIVDLSNIPAEGIYMGRGSRPKFGKITLNNSNATQGMQAFVTDETQYTLKIRETLGETYESAAIAYILSTCIDSKDNPSGKLETNTQIAVWKEDYYKDIVNGGESSDYGRDDGGLYEEAKVYQKYREDIEKLKEKNNGKVIKDTIVNRTVSTNIEKKEQILRTIYS